MFAVRPQSKGPATLEDLRNPARRRKLDRSTRHSVEVGKIGKTAVRVEYSHFGGWAMNWLHTVSGTSNNYPGVGKPDDDGHGMTFEQVRSRAMSWAGAELARRPHLSKMEE